MNRSNLSETDILTKYITRVLLHTGEDLHKQLQEESSLVGQVRVLNVSPPR